MVKDAKLPYIVVNTNPTSGGVSASFGSLGDITLAEPNALICFAGPRVISNTVGETLPDGFQKSEYLLEHGFIDQVVHRKELKTKIAQILSLLLKRSANLTVTNQQIDNILSELLELHLLCPLKIAAPTS